LQSVVSSEDSPSLGVNSLISTLQSLHTLLPPNPKLGPAVLAVGYSSQYILKGQMAAWVVRKQALFGITEGNDAPQHHPIMRSLTLEKYRKIDPKIWPT
jgi:hypothetical protein